MVYYNYYIIYYLGCLIINLCDTIYQEPFFKAYKDRNTLNPDKQPIVTFTIDERLIESIGAEYVYIIYYYYISLLAIMYLLIISIQLLMIIAKK